MADLRRAGVPDAERLGRQFAAGVEVYVEFAPPEWPLPSAAGERARRFYEREGWAAAGGEFHDPAPDLVLVEYRLEL
jgi:hypothetical protein